MTQRLFGDGPVAGTDADLLHLVAEADPAVLPALRAWCGTEDGLLEEDAFWRSVRDCLEQHAADHPELAEAVRRYDLLRPEFQHSCLNRLQLRNTLEMVDLAGPADSMLHAGTLANPAAR